jgi:predicted NAD-dependent protein-ADP-ribosyltransferase YbiA (DUF1768 family)
MQEIENKIYFFDKESDVIKPEHLFLCNYYPSPFIADDDFNFLTVEHYYHVIRLDNNYRLIYLMILKDTQILKATSNL